MEINIGDNVRFLNDVGGGTVTKIIDRKSVMVMNEYGFEVPTQNIELVVIEESPLYNEVSNTENEANSKPSAEIVVDTKGIFYPDVELNEESGNDINIYLAFVPQGRPGNSNLDIYLINDSNYNLLYSIITHENGTTNSNAVGILEANLKEQTESIALNNINEIPEYEFHFIFYRKGSFESKKPEKINFRISPVKFLKERSYKENDFFNEDAILMPLIETNKMMGSLKNLTSEDIVTAINEKEKKDIKPKVVSKKEKEKEILEVDLHIHELLDDFRGLSNGEIMEVQLEHFHLKIKEATKSKIKKVVFIHGIGNGSLKQEIRKELDKLKGQVSYQDASFKDYGYGATMAFIKQ